MPGITNAIGNTSGVSNPGNTNTFFIQNPSNTASSVARNYIFVGGASSGDVFTRYEIGGVTDFSIGIDNNDNDNFKISQFSSLGTNDTWIMTTAGERTMPLQPAFLAILGTTDTNALGNGVVYTYGSSGTALTEIFDQNNDFNPTTGVFTAPVTGRYILGMSMNLSGMSSAHTDAQLFISTTSRGYYSPLWNPYATRNLGGGSAEIATTMADLTAGDTVTFKGQLNYGTQTVSVYAILSTCRVWGYLAC